MFFVGIPYKSIIRWLYEHYLCFNEEKEIGFIMFIYDEYSHLVLCDFKFVIWTCGYINIKNDILKSPSQVSLKGKQ